MNGHFLPPPPFCSAPPDGYKLYTVYLPWNKRPLAASGHPNLGDTLYYEAFVIYNPVVKDL